MRNLTRLTNSKNKTMSSAEIAELTCKHHDSVMRTVEILSKKGIIHSPQIVEQYGVNNNTREIYQLNKVESLNLVSHLSPEFMARIIGRWREIEEGPAATSNIKAFEPSAELSETRKVFHEAKLIAIIAGFKGNQAILSAQKLTVRITDLDPLAMIGAVHLIADNQEQLITPTDIGVRLDNRSARSVNTLLHSFGFQEPVRNLKGKRQWELTAKGSEAGGTYLDTGKKHSDGSAIRQVKWGASIVEALKSLLQDQAA